MIGLFKELCKNSIPTFEGYIKIIQRIRLIRIKDSKKQSLPLSDLLLLSDLLPLFFFLFL